MIINNLIFPLIIIIVIFYGYYKKVNIYESFLEGIKEGFLTIIDIAPTIISMVFAINIFLDSKIINYLIGFNSYINSDILSMIVLRPVSGNATLSILNSIYIKYGVDSSIGFIASLIQGSTETTVYVIALYYSYINVKKIKNTLKIGLIVDLFGIILALFIAAIIL